MIKYIRKTSTEFKLIILFTLIAFGLPYLGFVHTDIKPFVKELEELSNGNLVPNQVTFGVMHKTQWAAYCSRSSKNIVIRKEYFEKINRKRKLSLLAHEIGHCQKGLRHSNGMRFGCPVSLMHYRTISNSCLEKNWSRYVQEMRSM